MKKIIFILIAVLVSSCATYRVPEMVSDSLISNPNIKVKVLGTISISSYDSSLRAYWASEKRDLSGIRTLLIRAAIQKYGGAVNYVTDITVTSLLKSSIFGATKLEYIIEGTALQIQ